MNSNYVVYSTRGEEEDRVYMTRFTIISGGYIINALES